MEINADRRQTAVMQGATLRWSPSPEPGVERRYLERVGAEVALATTIVRYRPGARFAAHRHELGEEIFVLEGTFSDQDGNYPAGTYVRNPPGSTHAPYSVDGCVIFVKLRHMDPQDRDLVRVLPEQRAWRGPPGAQQTVLYEADGVQVSLEHLGPGRAVSSAPNGLELFVLSGALHSPDLGWPALKAWGWLRSLEAPALVCAEETLLWVKRGHLRWPTL